MNVCIYITFRCRTYRRPKIHILMHINMHPYISTNTYHILFRRTICIVYIGNKSIRAHVPLISTKHYIYIHTFEHTFIYTYTYIMYFSYRPQKNIAQVPRILMWCYGVATIRRLLQIIGLFCRISSLL